MGLLMATVVFAVPVAAWLAAVHPGIALGALWLIALNGVPLIDLQSGTGQLRPTDLAVLAIVLMGVFRWLLDSRDRSVLPTSIATMCSLLGVWWFITLVRSLDAGVPVADAFLFGRDFLSFIVVIPAAWLLLATPAARRECAVVVVVGVGIYALFYVAGALGLLDAVRFTHPQQIRTAGSIQRLYTPMNDLVVTVSVFGAALLATTRRSRATPWIAVLTGVTFLAFLLQLTRAAYLGMAVGGVIAVAIALTRGARVRRVLMRRAATLVVAVGIAGFATVGLGATSLPTGEVGQRISSGFSDISETSGTIGYRLNVYNRMFVVLGPDWPAGLGFLHPRDRYFPDLPDGTIRNADVGLLNGVMTMGLVGLLLLLFVPLAVARHVAQMRHQRPAWLMVGFFGWLSLLIVTSPTLITLFSPTGLLSTGLTLALCGAGTGYPGKGPQTPAHAASILHL
jgi:hypothetical protein